MPPAIKNHPRRTLTLLFAAVVALADSIESAEFIFAWIQQRTGLILAILSGVVFLTYMKGQDHDRNDYEVRARLGEVEEDNKVFRRCFRFLLKKQGEEGAAEADVIFGKEESK